jgi:ligand-binding SRPBCC domain-containing protein
MHFIVKTKINKPFDQVVSSFDQDLFVAIAPPGMPMRLLRFDGCNKNDIVEIQLGLGTFSTKWRSLITYHESSEEVFHFIDKGVIIPWPLKKWEHKHYVYKTGDESLIVDNVTFSTSSRLMDVFSFLPFYLSILYRVYAYKKYFSKRIKS